MTKKELIGRIVSVLHSNSVSKKISIPKQVFHISDDEGNCKDFVVRKVDKGVSFNSNDVAYIVDACLLVIEDAIRRGEEVTLQGFGTFGVHHRAARKTKKIGTDEWIDIDARYVPKFVSGNNLKVAAKIYEMSLCESPEPKDGE